MSQEHKKSNSTRKSSFEDTVKELSEHPDEISRKYSNLIEDTSKKSFEEGEVKEKYLKSNLTSSDDSINDMVPRKPKFSLIRFFVSTAVIVISSINSYYKIIVPGAEPTYLVDYSHEATEHWNSYLRDNTEIRKTLFSTTAYIQDFSLIILCLLWIFKGYNWKPLIAFIANFITKVICMYTITFITPKGYMWDGPGYSSLSFSSRSDWNFFYSGSIGINIICAYFLRDYGFKLTKLFSLVAFLNAIFQVGFFIAVRSTYIIDVLSVILMGHYFCYLSEYFDPYFQSVFPLKTYEFPPKDDLLLKKQKSN